MMEVKTTIQMSFVILAVSTVLVLPVHSEEADLAELNQQLMRRRELIKLSNQADLAELRQQLEAKGIEQLIEEIKSDSSTMRKKIWLLGEMKDERLVSPLIVNFLEDASQPGSGREAAARALGKLGDSAAVEPLINVLKTDPSWSVKSAAISALGALGDKRASETLKRLLKDDDTIIRLNAAEALGQIKDRMAIESLVQSIKQDDIMKEVCMSALSQIGDTKVVEIFASFLDLEDIELKIKAAVYLLDFEDSKAKKLKTKALRILEEYSYIEEVTSYDKYNRPRSVWLKNVKGQTVAEIENEFHQYNDTLLKRQITDKKRGNIIRVTDYDRYGKPKNLMYLCLDIKGDLIEKDGKPVLVRPFEAEQKSHTQVYYTDLSRRFKSSQKRRIYRCENCADETGIKNCRFVW